IKNLRYLPLDLGGRLDHAVGQTPDLDRNHTETFPGLTRTGRLKRSIERDQLGLVGNVVDNFHYLVDLFGLSSQLDDLAQICLNVQTYVVDLEAEVFNLGGAVFGIVKRLVGSLHNTLAMLGYLAGRGSKLFHGGRYLHHRAGKLGGKPGLMIHAGCNCADVGVEFFGYTGNLADNLMQPSDMLVEPAGELAHFIGSSNRNCYGQVVVEVLQYAGNGFNRSGNEPVYQEKHHDLYKDQNGQRYRNILKDAARNLPFDNTVLLGNQDIDVVHIDAGGDDPVPGRNCPGKGDLRLHLLLSGHLPYVVHISFTLVTANLGYLLQDVDAVRVAEIALILPLQAGIWMADHDVIEIVDPEIAVLAVAHVFDGFPGILSRHLLQYTHRHVHKAFDLLLL